VSQGWFLHYVIPCEDCGVRMAVSNRKRTRCPECDPLTARPTDEGDGPVPKQRYRKRRKLVLPVAVADEEDYPVGKVEG
jgi:hypothetical protein